MLKEKVVRSSLRLVGGRAGGALRSSIDFLSDERLLDQSGTLPSLSESCNFAERASLPHERMFRKPQPRTMVLGGSTENLSPNLIHSEHKCQNHESKPAQFRVATEDDEMFYCQRCAISLASQGFNVCRIDEQFVEMPKKQKITTRPIEVDFLLDHIELIRQGLNKKQSQAVNQQHSNRQMMDKLEEELVGHFKQLDDLLQEAKKKTMQEFQKEREQFIGTQPSSEPIYLEAVRDLDSIAQEIRTQPYTDGPSNKQRLSSYRSRLEIYRKILGGPTDSISKPLIRYKPITEVADPLHELLRVEFNLQPKSQLFSFCKSTASSNTDGRQPVRPVSQFGGCK